MTILGNVAGKLNSFFGIRGDGDSAAEANDLSHADPHTLPPNPWAASPSPPPQIDGSIDLTSSDSPTAIYEDGLLPESTRSRLQRPKKPKQRKPSDATPVPNPAIYRGPSAMKKVRRAAAKTDSEESADTSQPGAGKGVVPMNTLNATSIADRHNPAYGKRTTYGKIDRNARSIGQERHSGQQAFLAQNPGHKTATSPSYSLSHGSPAKRRKTDHPTLARRSPNIVVELDNSDDDEIQQVPARQASTPGAQSVPSSKSPRSITSKISGNSSRPASQITSEFAKTDGLMQPKRAKPPRRQSSKIFSVHPGEARDDVPFYGAGGLPVVPFITDDGFQDRPTARRSILTDFEQGVSRESLPSEARHTDGSVRSTHFSKMQIKESTVESEERAARAAEAGSRASKNLREFQSADSEVKNDAIEGSEDELAPLSPNTSRTRGRKSSSKTPQTYKSAAVKRRSAAGQSYQLEYARSYEFDGTQTQLLLECTDNPKKFKITGQDTSGKIKLLKVLDLASVTKITSDNTHNMRLTGSSVDGNIYWCDLTFTKFPDYQIFLQTYVHPEVAEKSRFPRDKVKMAELFKRPLKKNDKIGTTPMVVDEVTAEQANSEQHRTPRGGLLAELTNSVRDEGGTATLNRNSLKQPPTSTRAQTRPVRNTRATAPLYDEEMPVETKKVFKYSQIEGLGEPWDKPVVFQGSGEGFLSHRKGIVNWSDLPALDEEEWVNDELINFYMLFLYNRYRVSTDRVYFFTTHFFESLTRNTKGRDAINYDAVKSWTKRHDVFSYDYIVVPINELSHWYLAIICNVSKIARKPAISDSEKDLLGSDQTAIGAQLDGSMDKFVNDNAEAKVSSDTEKTIAAMDEPPVKQAVLDEDENLFEEEKSLNLINRDDAGAAPETLSHTKEDPAGQQRPNGDSTIAALSSVPDEKVLLDVLPDDAKQAPKKNPNKRKGQVQRRNPDNPVIVILDSMEGTHSNATRALREWLQAEGLERRGMTVEVDNKGFYPKRAHIPIQKNFYDCGLYVLGFAAKFFQDPDKFKNKLLTGEMSAETDWPDLDASNMRNELRSLLQKLHAEQAEARRKESKDRKAARKSATSSPSKGASRRASPTVQQLSKVDKGTSATSTISEAEVEKEQPPETAQDQQEACLAALPRLGSPFVLTKEKVQISSSGVEGKEESTAPLPSSPAKTPAAGSTTKIPAQSKHTTVKRQISPQVRLSATPPIDRTSYVRYDGTLDPSHQTAQQSTDLTSPLRKQGLRSNDDGKLRMPISRRIPASSPSRPLHRRPEPSNPLQPRQRSGSHDDPITLEDSQDLDAPVQQQYRSTRKLPPEIIELDRSQESIAPPSRRTNARPQSSPSKAKYHSQAVAHEDSIQEIDDYEWREGRDITKALRASLAEEDQSLSEHSASPPHEPMEDVHDTQGTYSESSHTMQGVPDTQAMEIDDQDAVVAETPERQRSSPGVDDMEWQAGDQLP